MSLVNLDKSLGFLKTPITDEIIEYEAFEFSSYSLGILSPVNLDQGLFCHYGNSPKWTGAVQCTCQAEKIRRLVLFRYRLTCPESTSI